MMPASGPTNLSIPIGDQNNQGAPGSQVGGEDLDTWAHQVRHDLLTIIWWIQSHTETTHLTGMGKLNMPLAGQARLYFSVDTALAQNGANYWTFQGIRSGQAEQPITVSTQLVAVSAYTEQYLGEFTVSQGDTLSLTFSATGAPTALTITNFAIRCELTERPNKYG